jgi:hypothetical protein
MVIKGTSCAGARRIAAHLSCTETNERNEVYELRGVAADDLRGALLEMEAVALGTRTTRPFYHASINTPVHERMTDAQRRHAIDRLEAALGLSDQPRVVVIHEKKQREHCHIVWSRIDVERMRAISDSHNFAKHEQVARDLEREFGHAPVPGAHVERNGRPRPQRTPSHTEMLQAERTGLRPQDVKEQITGIWRITASGREFADNLVQAGFMLARGDRRDFVIVDRKGGVHSLARRIDGARASDIRARMADLDPMAFLTVAEARRIQRERPGQIPSQVRMASSMRGKKVQSAGPRTSSTPAPCRVRKPPPSKAFARYTRFHRANGLGGGGNRPPFELAPTGLRTREAASAIHYQYGGYFEFRPPVHYAPLKRGPSLGSVMRFGFGADVGCSHSFGAVVGRGADYRIELSRSITSSSRPAEYLRESGSGEVSGSSQGDTDGGNAELTQLLGAIADEVCRHCAMVCQGIVAQSAARRTSARNILSKDQIDAALAAISAECRAALAAARRDAKIELAGRLRAMKARYGRPPRRPVAPTLAEAPARGRAQPP